jgi:hypothetical protein
MTLTSRNKRFLKSLQNLKIFFLILASISFIFAIYSYILWGSIVNTTAKKYNQTYEDLQGMGPDTQHEVSLKKTILVQSKRIQGLHLSLLLLSKKAMVTMGLIFGMYFISLFGIIRQFGSIIRELNIDIEKEVNK